jgi:phosphonopyruvate decarboxylase
VFEKGSKDSGLKPTKDLPLSREAAIGILLDCLPSDAIYVATTGRATRELFALREIRGDKHNNDFLMVGSMGHASQIALGLAIAKPKRTVVCLDGDGALIMHLGGLTTIGKMNPKNLIHVVLNNGTHESVGGQTTAGFLIDFTTIACKSGYNVTFNPLVNKIQVIHAIDSLLPLGGPIFLDIHIHNGIRDGIGKLKTCHVNDKNEFTKNIRSN